MAGDEKIISNKLDPLGVVEQPVTVSTIGRALLVSLRRAVRPGKSCRAPKADDPLSLSDAAASRFANPAKPPATRSRRAGAVGSAAARWASRCTRYLSDRPRGHAPPERGSRRAGAAHAVGSPRSNQFVVVEEFFR